MAVTITHTTPADGTFSATGAAAWDANHAVSGLGTMAEQNANNVNITGGSISGVTGVAASGANSDITSLSGLTTPLSLLQGGTGASTQSGAANAILPSQTSNSGKYLTTDGSNVSWASVSGSGITLAEARKVASLRL